MRRLCSILALALVLLFAAAGAGSAHLNDYNAANDDGKIVVRYNSTMTPEYQKYLDTAFSSWNKARSDTGGVNFPEFVYDTPEIRSTLNVGLYSESNSTLGFYRHYSGVKTDLLRLNTATLGRKPAANKQRTATHEAGHAAMFTHNDFSCRESVMPQTSTCGSSFSQAPAVHDRSDVAKAPKMWSDNDAGSAGITQQIEEEAVGDLPVGYAKREILVEGEERTVVSETLRYPDGFLIVEYDAP